MSYFSKDNPESDRMQKMAESYDSPEREDDDSYHDEYWADAEPRTVEITCSECGAKHTTEYQPSSDLYSSPFHSDATGNFCVGSGCIAYPDLWEDPDYPGDEGW